MLDLVEVLELVMEWIMFVVGVVVNLLEMERGREFKCFVWVFVVERIIGFDWIKIYIMCVLIGIVVL